MDISSLAKWASYNVWRRVDNIRLRAGQYIRVGISGNYSQLADTQSTFANKLILTMESLTIASGVVTVSMSNVRVAAESGTADDLATINGGVDGMLLILASDTGDTITVKDNTGNIDCPGSSDITLSSPRDTILLRYRGNISKWLVISSETGY